MQSVELLIKKASLVGAFCVLYGSLAAAAPTTASCGPPATTRTVTVLQVHDGDTLLLSDHTRVRLIGINTPEVADRGTPAQPLALRARERLRQLLFQQGNQVLLTPGAQPRDDYGRTLANLWLPGGENLTAEILEDGLGWLLAIPPNIHFLPCYQQAETAARQAGRGVWGRPEYAALPSTELKLRDSGFKRVRGRIIRVNRAAGAIWINLQGRFAIRIPDDDSVWFNPPPDTGWVGREVEVSGWIKQIKGELRVNLSHPAMLRQLSP
jgi:endonuclease YncB( thermonuclease family)